MCQWAAPRTCCENEDFRQHGVLRGRNAKCSGIIDLDPGYLTPRAKPGTFVLSGFGKRAGCLDGVRLAPVSTTENGAFQGRAQRGLDRAGFARSQKLEVMTRSACSQHAIASELEFRFVLNRLNRSGETKLASRRIARGYQSLLGSAVI